MVVVVVRDVVPGVVVVAVVAVGLVVRVPPSRSRRRPFKAGVAVKGVNNDESMETRRLRPLLGVRLVDVRDARRRRGRRRGVV